MYFLRNCTENVNSNSQTVKVINTLKTFSSIFYFFWQHIRHQEPFGCYGILCFFEVFFQKVIAVTYQPWALNSKYCTESCSISISEWKSKETENPFNKRGRKRPVRGFPEQGGLESVKMWIPRCLKCGTVQFHPSKKTVEQPGLPDSNQQIVIESDG